MGVWHERYDRTTVSTMSPPSIDRPTTLDRFAEALEPILDQTRAVSFWGAITLPFVYLPFLATGVDSPTRAGILLALVGINLVAVLVGRGHDPQ